MANIKLDKFNYDKIVEEIEKGNSVEYPCEKGEMVSKSLAEGYTPYLNAKVELVREKNENEDLGLCGCGKPNNIIVRAFR